MGGILTNDEKVAAELNAHLSAPSFLMSGHGLVLIAGRGRRWQGGGSCWEVDG